MQNKVNLSNITVNDIANAKSNEFAGFAVCPAGMHDFKILNFNETDGFNQIEVQEGTTKYRFFYNYCLRGTDQLDADLLNWMKSLATIPVQPNTTFQEITNSAIGRTYKIETYTYTSKSGKNAGKEVAAIQWKTLPEPVIINDVTEIAEQELPF